MNGYLSLVAIVVFGFVALAIIFIILNRLKGRSRDIAGLLFVGPAHFILKRHGYSLSKREIIGWGVVLLLMLAAPLITNWLEK